LDSKSHPYDGVPKGGIAETLKLSLNLSPDDRMPKA
jgi:hypothetical protein